MAGATPSILSHISIGTNQFDKATAFYDQVLAHPGAVAYGRRFSFVVSNRAAVPDFYQAALDAGARDEDAPDPRAEYGESYCGCCVRDWDGDKIEAVFWSLDMLYERHIEPHEH